MPSEEHKQAYFDMQEFEKLQLKADKRLLKRILKMREDYDLKHKAIVQKRTDKMLEILSEYKNEDEVQEAWGWGCITDAERDNAMAVIRGEQAKIDRDSEYSIMEQWLRQLSGQITNEIIELRYSLMTPEQKLQHNQAVDDWGKKITELRRKHGGK